MQNVSSKIPADYTDPWGLDSKFYFNLKISGKSEIQLIFMNTTIVWPYTLKSSHPTLKLNLVNSMLQKLNLLGLFSYL